MKDFVKVVEKKGELFIKAEGKSMFPIFHPGDTLHIKKLSFTNLKTNDIALIKKEEQILIHRVIYKTDKYLISKGDRNTKSDGKISPNQIIGKVDKIKFGNQIIDVKSIYLLQSTSYFNEIVSLKKELEEKNIKSVFLKGLPLHLYYEKTHPRRIYLDCDLLIPKKAFPKTKKIFTKLEYTQIEAPLSFLHKKMQKKRVEVSFKKILHGMFVIFDVHFKPVFMMTQIRNPQALYPKELVEKLTKDFFREKKLVKIQKNKFPILNITNLIIYLSLHFFHHNFRGAFRLNFLDQVIRNALKDLKSKKAHENNFEAIAQKIKKYKLEAFVYPSFLLAKKYFKTPIPASFLKQIKPKKYKLTYIKKNLLSINIFNDQTRTKAGTERFKNLFFLSPQPFYRKVLVFLEPQVVYTILLVIYRRPFDFLYSLIKNKPLL